MVTASGLHYRNLDAAPLLLMAALAASDRVRGRAVILGRLHPLMLLADLTLAPLPLVLLTRARRRNVVGNVRLLDLIAPPQSVDAAGVAATLQNLSLGGAGLLVADALVFVLRRNLLPVHTYGSRYLSSNQPSEEKLMLTPLLLCPVLPNGVLDTAPRVVARVAFVTLALHAPPQSRRGIHYPLVGSFFTHFLQSLHSQ